MTQGRSTTDIAIIGGGLAGAALAIQSASHGRQVTLIEREAGPHDKVCGEFLSREALLHLRALDIDPARLGGMPIDRVRLATGRAMAEVVLPFQGMGLSRRVLDEALLARAQAGGATLRRGSAAGGLDGGPGEHRVRLQDGCEIVARDVVLATGKHDLRGWKRGPGRQNDLVGFKQHFRLTPGQAARLAGAVELTLFAGGYAGLQLVEDGQATLCLLVRRSRLAELGGRWGGVLASVAEDAPLLGERLAGAQPVQSRPLTISGIPYGFVAPATAGPSGAGIWRLGDQSAVIPSFTGDGMSIALHSAALAARMLREGSTPDDLQEAMRRDVGRQVAGAALLSLGAVRRPLQRPLVAIARLVPAISTAIAAATRIPDAALQRGLAGVRA
ncbi:FAD-dependent oxidoreductase [Lichenicola cladoniae]|uniref:FAD-dependent oxidoreductase n=1 Tax=Lichenicola cladoniae TaxID=1484109 RepID=A0A6M8HNR7_9PROT|nr:FAD-dependent oxidoreductase [Lichenicola cladoniae]NPD67511.1 FAD-dependent oxidoreductase [Acetobacteraceae bacterium]QKE89966.1 FAD-dependent oxidoreductase [Lichenicola cladoniae]